MTDIATRTGAASSAIEDWQRVETALQRIQWACDSRHLTQAALIRRLMDLPLQTYMGGHKSASTIKGYLQGNLPKNSPDLINGLVAAVAACFHLETELFFKPEISREAFCQAICRADHASVQKLAALKTENGVLKAKVNHLTAQLEAVAGERSARRHLKQRLSRRMVAVAGVLSLLLGGALLWGFNSHPDPYPPREAPEIASALLDGRDLVLNTPETPMQVAYGSQLCVEMTVPHYYVSAFVADNGFYFNQEGRLLTVPNGDSPACTGVWPGIPDAFRATPYQLFIVVAEERLPVSGDGDRLRALPGTHYFGPIYLQRTQ
ncbi:MAG: hypothetical protein P8010_12605 [Desulfosarcinaceae bacterium]|jgi:hypothetical protein